MLHSWLLEKGTGLGTTDYVVQDSHYCMKGWERKTPCSARLLSHGTLGHSYTQKWPDLFLPKGSGSLCNFPSTQQGLTHSSRLKLGSLAEDELSLLSLSQKSCTVLRTRKHEKAGNFHTVTLPCQRHYPFLLAPQLERWRMSGLLGKNSALNSV